jgi:hypothetical protein
MLVSAPHSRCSASFLVTLLLAIVVPFGGRAQSPVVRYRVEQVLRLETTQSQRDPATLQAAPLTTAVEGRVRFVLEQGLRDAAAGKGTWRFTKVEVEGPRTEPPGAADAGVQRALALGLSWMKELDGQAVSGNWEEIPVLPLGEAPPPWLTAWLRWAQTGHFSGLEGSPVRFPSRAGRETRADYDLTWQRSDFRQRPCHVQQARWVLPVVSSAESVTVELAAKGVQARTHFAAQSLEWVTQTDPALVYAERSGVRETFWDMSRVEDPDLRDMVFRLRLSVQVRVEWLP